MRPMNGKTALVTGASSGIGRAIAKRFAEDGARVYLTGRRKDELEAAAEDVGPDAVAVPCDVSRAADLDRVMEVIRGDGRQLDTVVANAGLGDGALLADVTEEQFDLVFGVNTKGSLLTVQKSLPLLARPASVNSTAPRNWMRMPVVPYAAPGAPRHASPATAACVWTPCRPGGGRFADDAPVLLSTDRSARRRSPRIGHSDPESKDVSSNQDGRGHEQERCGKQRGIGDRVAGAGRTGGPGRTEEK